MRILLVCLLSSLIIATIAFGYRLDMKDVRRTLGEGSVVVETARGPVACRTGGTGAPVLVIHGAGGGHDQGRLLAEAFLPPGYRWIAPSRFGYPGTIMPEDASTAAQADAFASLLDALELERVTILAMSGGVPPALQFAVRHPERTGELILISLAPFAPLTAEEQALPVPLWLYDALFAADFPLWLVLRVAPRRLAPVVDARSELLSRMTAAEGQFLDALLATFLPATQRRRGLANEGAAIAAEASIDVAAIRAPTLVIQARDDRITPFSTAAFAVEHLKDAELLAFDRGGHLLLGQHDRIRVRIADFLALHGGTALAGLPAALDVPAVPWACRANEPGSMYAVAPSAVSADRCRYVAFDEGQKWQISSRP